VRSGGSLTRHRRRTCWPRREHVTASRFLARAPDRRASRRNPDAPEPAISAGVPDPAGITRHVRAPGASHHDFDEPFERARREKVPVVWIQHSDDELAHGSDGWQIVSALAPGAAEPLVEKNLWRRIRGHHSRDRAFPGWLSGDWWWSARRPIGASAPRRTVPWLGATTRPSSAMRIRRKTRLIGRRRRRTRSRAQEPVLGTPDRAGANHRNGGLKRGRFRRPDLRQSRARSPAWRVVPPVPGCRYHEAALTASAPDDVVNLEDLLGNEGRESDASRGAPREPLQRQRSHTALRPPDRWI